MATAVIIREGYLPHFSFIFIPFHLSIIYFNLFSSFYHLISTSGHNFLPLFFLLFFLLTCHTSSFFGHLSLLFNSPFPSWCYSLQCSLPLLLSVYSLLSSLFSTLLFHSLFLLPSSSTSTLHISFSSTHPNFLVFSYPLFSSPFSFTFSSPPVSFPPLFSSLPVFFRRSSPHDFHPPLSTPYPIIFPLCSSSPPLSISAITQFSRVFPFQILSPCITSDLLLGVPVDYLCALLSICARSCLPPPHAQIAAKGSGINIQALQAFGGRDVW